MEHRRKIPIEIAIDGEEVRSETLMSDVGAYVVVLGTTLADLGVDVHSVYVGHPKVRTQATQMLLRPDLQEATTVEHDHEAIPVTHARRRCLFDHLQQLQALLEETGADAQIKTEDEAITVVED
jgi:hypothetical protein